MYSQVSFYDGKNPYVRHYNDGEIIRVNINSLFAVTVSGEWNRNFEVDLKLMPDKKNLNFLQDSEQTRNNSRKSKERQNVTEKFKFTISAVITRDPTGNYRLTANRIINLDGKITRVVCTGLVHEKSISNGAVNSDEIAELNLTVISQPQPARDETYNGPAPEKEDVNAAGQEEKTGGPEGNFSKEEMRKYIVEYMKEILGALR